jgi:hypothetical protein
MLYRAGTTDDHHLFVHVLQLSPKDFEIVGYMLGSDAKNVGKFDNPGNRKPAYFVHRRLLNSMDEVNWIYQ